MAAGNPIESDTSEFFESGMGTVLFVSLFTKKGISRKDTLETYGAKGNEIVNRMIEAGIAKESKSGHLVAEEKWYSHRSPQEVLRVMRNLNVDFDHSLIGSPLARMAVLTESVKMEDAARIQLILDEAIIEVRKIMDESASTGDNVVAVSFLMQAIK